MEHELRKVGTSPTHRWPARPRRNLDAPKARGRACGSFKWLNWTIRERACRLWEQAGRPEGMDQHFWLEAKRQLKDELVRHEPKTPDNP